MGKTLSQSLSRPFFAQLLTLFCHGDTGKRKLGAYLLITDIDDTSLTSVFGSEFISQCFEHDTALYEVIQLHTSLISTIKCLDTQLAELGRPVARDTSIGSSCFYTEKSAADCGEALPIVEKRCQLWRSSG